MAKRKKRTLSESRNEREVAKRRRSARAQANRSARQNEDYREEEQKKDTNARRVTRQSTAYRQQEQERDTEAHSSRRQDPTVRTPEKKRDAEARSSRRQNPAVRNLEKKGDAEAHRSRRQNPTLRTPEKKRDAEAHSSRRQDPTVRIPEKKRDSEAHSSRRHDPKVRTLEKKRDAEAHSNRRHDPTLRIQEKKRDAEAHSSRRQDPTVRTREKKRDAEAHSGRRQDPAVRTLEKKKDAEAHNARRLSPAVRTAEREKDTQARRNKTQLAHSTYDGLLNLYNKKIRNAPTFVCSCCGGLWYEDSTVSTSINCLLDAGCTADFIQLVLLVPQYQHRLCGTCNNRIKKKQVPKLALSNGFDFPKMPQELKDLSPLEERLVAPRIPFMQIRAVGSERQSVLKGNVVNVENDLDVCATILPRRFDDTSTVQVQLMRRMRYRVPYMYETIRPKKVYNAAKLLINTEAYQNLGIELCDKWSRCEDGETMNFICDPGDFVEGPNLSKESSPVHDENIQDEEYDPGNQPPEDTNNIGAEETLFFQEADSSRGMRIAPAEGKIPMPMFIDPNAEILSFPTIYGGNERKFNDKIRVTYTDIAKSELRRYDRRACRPAKLLYSFKQSFNQKVHQAVQISMRKKVGKVKASALRVPGCIEKLIQNDDGYAVFKNIRSSPSYWKHKTKTVLAMLRSLGKFTFFITLSAAETKWTELKVMLMKIIKKKEITEEEAETLTFQEVSEIIRSDPVTCMRHFDHRYRTLLNLFLKPDAGIFHQYKLKDYVSRLEFQMRGSPHSHGLYWLEEAPQYVEGNAESMKECLEFIDKFITTDRDEEGEMEQLIAYQLHKHSHTCNKGHAEKCRFAFPKPPMRESMILIPLDEDYNATQRNQARQMYTVIQVKLNEMGRSFKEVVEHQEFMESLNITQEDYILAVRSSIKRTTVFYRRAPNAAFINGYNRKLLLAWRANIDIQFVLDTYACAKYCVGYILKSAGGVSKLRQAATRLARRGDTVVQDKLKKFANILINGSEISAQEAAAFLLSIPNTYSSRQDIFINTAPPAERVGILKSTKELDELEDDSEDVCAKSITDRYIKRPKKFEAMCLAEFASNYDFQKSKAASIDVAGAEKDAPPSDDEDLINTNDDVNMEKVVQAICSSSSATKRKRQPYITLLDNSGTIRKRRTSKIIRFRHYGKKEDPDNYNRERLMLFVPWRNEDEELLSINSTSEATEKKSIIDLNSKPFFFSSEIDDESLENWVNEVEEDENGSSEDGNTVLDDLDVEPDTEFVDEFATGSSRVEQFLVPGRFDNEKYTNIMRSLNEEQRRFVLETLHHLKTSKNPIYGFLSGGAGVGKSHAVHAIVQSCLRCDKTNLENPEQVCVSVGAPTGMAAFNVFGMTLHTLLKLPPSQCGKRVSNLDDSAINTLRTKLINVDLFIIDEVSMVSVNQLYDIDHRLRQVFASSEDFGGKSVIFVGHLRQLEPVMAPFIFKIPKHIPLGELVGKHLWQKFKFFELREIMRQRGEYEFCKALNNMADGCMDEDDKALIRSLQIVKGVRDPPANAIHLFATNAECREHNKTAHDRLKLEGREGVMSTAFDAVQGTGSKASKDNLKERAKEFTTQQADGIPYQTYLQVGGEYFVSTNIDVSDGLFNGSTGSLETIDYAQKQISDEVKPVAVWMDFRNDLIGSASRKSTATLQRRKKYPSHWVRIGQIKRNLSKNFKHKGLQIIRTQIPVVAANGMTINKAQGSTKKYVVVCVRPNPHRKRKLSRAKLYVGCSRATTRDGLYIDGEFEAPPAPAPDDEVSLEIIRLRNNPFPFKLRFLQDYGGDFNKIYYHNVEGFISHREDVFADQCAMAADILAFVEPQLIATDNLDLQNHITLDRRPCEIPNGKKNSKGSLILKRTSSSIHTSTTSFFENVNGPGHCLILTCPLADNTLVLVYKHPCYSERVFFAKLHQCLRVITGNVILLGDINTDLKNPATASEVKCFFDNFKLSSKLNTNDPSTNKGTHIDCCFSNVEHVEAWFYESYYSYHKPICIAWKKHDV